jgi:hypothetical protein
VLRYRRPTYYVVVVGSWPGTWSGSITRAGGRVQNDASEKLDQRRVSEHEWLIARFFGMEAVS